MEDKLSIKSNAVELLEKQLHNRAKKKQYGVIVMSSATEPYLQFEVQTKLTRSLLEVILKYRFPVHIITRSDLVERDFDLLKQIDTVAIHPDEVRQQVSRGVFVTFSFSTLDDKTAKIFEPGATPPTLRLQTHKNTLQAGLHSGISLMPLIPHISDTTENLHEMFSTFKNIGSSYVFPASITLFGEERADSKTLMLRAIRDYYPELLEKYDRFFRNSTQLPKFYRDAFNKKMLELLREYNLSNRI